MYYPGSKERIAHAILFYILKGRNGRPYVEPFMGGANVMSNVSGVRYGNDINPYLISMWQALQSGWVPPQFVDSATFEEVKAHPDRYDPAFVGYVGFVCSFNSNWFSGYRGIVTRTRVDRNGVRLKENQQEWARNHLMRQVPNMIGVTLSYGEYTDMHIPDGSIVYCDPPYADVSKPYISDEFDTNSFWQWVRGMSLTDSTVFITEYTAPDDFTCIWEENIRPVGGTMHGNIQPNKLYVHQSKIHVIDTTLPTIPKLKVPS
jgi:DNA adenine methylase